MGWIAGSYLIYLLLPIVLLAIGSVGRVWTNTLLPRGLTGQWYLEVVRDPSFQWAFWSSLKVVGATCILATFCLISAVAIGAYGTALALVGTQINILPLLLYSKISETGSDFPAAAALSIVLMTITSAVMTLAEIFGHASRTVPSRFKKG